MLHDEIWAAAQARNISVLSKVTDEICMVNGDRQLLARAIVNLLSNAVKFSPEGSSGRADVASSSEREPSSAL